MSRPDLERSERPSALYHAGGYGVLEAIGLPIATTSWPDAALDESPSATEGRPCGAPDHREVGIRIIAHQPSARKR